VIQLLIAAVSFLLLRKVAGLPSFFASEKFDECSNVGWRALAGADPGIWKGGGGLLTLLPFPSPPSLSLPSLSSLPFPSHSPFPLASLSLPSLALPVPLPFPPPLEVGPLKSS